MAPSSSSSIRWKLIALLSSLLAGFLFLATTNRNDEVAQLLSQPVEDDDQSGTGIVNLLRGQGQADCLGAPYLYVTLHDKTANVLKFSRDGCLLSDNVLLMDEAYKSVFDVEFRSMAIGKHKDHDALFIADASDHNSRLLVFGKCIESMENYGKRHFVEIVVDSKHNKGVDHTYGVCLDKEGNVYISNQHTDSVLRFQVGSFKPMALPRSLQLDSRLDYYDGTFVQFGLPKQHEPSDQGVRAVCHVHDKIWIAHEEISGVAITDVASGLVTDIIPLDTPVGLFHDLNLGVVFVSCRSKERGGIVYALDAFNFKIRHSYVHKKMIHPTGIIIIFSIFHFFTDIFFYFFSISNYKYFRTILTRFFYFPFFFLLFFPVGMTTYDGILYVAEQHIGAILSFDIQSESFIRNVVRSLDKSDRIEQLVLSPC